MNDPRPARHVAEMDRLRGVQQALALSSTTRCYEMDPFVRPHGGGCTTGADRGPDQVNRPRRMVTVAAGSSSARVRRGCARSPCAIASVAYAAVAGIPSGSFFMIRVDAMTQDFLHTQVNERHSLGVQAVLLRGFALSFVDGLLPALDALAEASAFRHMVTPGGFSMSAAMTNCGRLGCPRRLGGSSVRCAQPVRRRGGDDFCRVVSDARGFCGSRPARAMDARLPRYGGRGSGRRGCR